MTCILTPSKYDVVTSLKERRSDNLAVLPAPMRFRPPLLFHDITGSATPVLKFHIPSYE